MLVPLIFSSGRRSVEQARTASKRRHAGHAILISARGRRAWWPRPDRSNGPPPADEQIRHRRRRSPEPWLSPWWDARSEAVIFELSARSDRLVTRCRPPFLPNPVGLSGRILTYRNTGRPLARCPPGGGSFSSDPRSEPRGLVSQHGALQRLLRGGGRVPVVDGLVAGTADHEGFPAHPGHELRPPGLCPSRPGEVGELADLVDFHVGRRLAVLTPPGAEPLDQLLAAGGRVGKAVGDDRLLLPFQRDATEPVRPVVSCPPGSTVAWKQMRGPCGVVIVARCFRAIAVTVERCLAASVLSSEVSAAQRSRASRQTSLASR